MKPTSIAETIAILKEYGLDAKIIAGGTELNELAKRGMLPHVRKLVDIEGLALDHINESEAGVTIGAMVTVADLMNAPAIVNNPAYAAVNEAVKRIQPLQVKNVATIGGALCSSLPLFDLPTAVLSVDATLRAVGPNGLREIQADRFFLDYFLPALHVGELVTEIRLPPFLDRTVSGFEKLQLTAEDLALANAAVRITVDSDGKCQDARICLGGRGTTRLPTRAKKAERVVAGSTLDDSALERAAKMASDEIRPVSDHRASSSYRRHVARVILGRLLKRLRDELQGRV